MMSIFTHLRSSALYLTPCSVFFATYFHDVKALKKLLLKPGVKVDAYCGNLAPLHIACGDRHYEILLLLLEHGATPSLPATCYAGWTPLHKAVDAGFHSVARLLILYGADEKFVSTRYIDSRPTNIPSQTPEQLSTNKPMMQKVIREAVALRNSIKENQDAAAQAEKSGLSTEAANCLYQVAKDWYAASTKEIVAMLRQHYYQKALSFAAQAQQLDTNSDLQAFIMDIKSRLEQLTDNTNQSVTTRGGLFTKHKQAKSDTLSNRRTYDEAAPLIGHKATL